MGQPAARVGDAAGHGGTIMLGSFKVLIGGMPAARMGDPLVCPGADGPKPHVMGNITMASTTVMIDGAFAARQGDTTGCGAAGVSGAGAPAVAGPPATPGVTGAYNNEGALVGDQHAGFGYGQSSGYTNRWGAQRQVKGSVEHADGTYNVPGGGTVTGSFDGLSGTAEAHAGVGAAGASAQVAGVTGQVRATNPDGSYAGAQGTIGSAQAGIDILCGTDGRRTGIGLGGALQASVAEGQIDSGQSFGIPFTDYNIIVGGTVGGSVGSVGGAANVGAYHDAADDRVHLAGMIDIEAVIGAKLGLDISFGRRASVGGGGGTPGVPVPLTPGTVIIGCATVLIG